MFIIACLATGSGCGMGENACKKYREGGEDQVSPGFNWSVNSGGVDLALVSGFSP